MNVEYEELQMDSHDANEVIDITTTITTIEFIYYYFVGLNDLHCVFQFFVQEIKKKVKKYLFTKMHLLLFD